MVHGVYGPACTESGINMTHLWKCPAHFQNVTTLPCKIQQVIFNSKSSRAFVYALSAHDTVFITGDKLFTVACCPATSLQNDLHHVSKNEHILRFDQLRQKSTNVNIFRYTDAKNQTLSYKY